MKKYEIISVELSQCWSDSVHNEGGFVLSWQCKGVGFGELTFYREKKTDKLICETECMSKDFIDAVFHFFLDKCVEYVDK